MGLLDQLNRLLGQPRGDTPGAGRGWDDIPADERDAVRAVERAVGREFLDPSLLHRALVHRSHAHAVGGDRLDTNERLEFLGDAVLGVVASEFLFRLHGDRDEGDLTRMKSRLVCGANLARVATDRALGDHILMSRGEEATGGRERASILADTVEAVIGAVYLDGGLEAARNVLDAWMLQDADEVIDLDDLVNNKSRLQEIAQARTKVPPRYNVVEVTGPDHDRHYVVEVVIDGRSLGTGRGPSKKTAEQEAAGAALEALAAEPEPTGEDTDDAAGN